MTCLALGMVLSVSAKREVEKNEEQAMENPLDILSQTL
jgi:cell division protein FtsW